jgi:Cu2+-exporting ATPase
MMVQIALYAGAFQGIEDSMRRLLEYTALLFCIPVVVYSAVPFFRSALTSIRHGLNMDAPIALAVSIAFTISLANTMQGSGEVYYDSVVMFTFLMLGARYLEQRLRHRLGIEDSLQAAMPRTAMVVHGEQMAATPLAAVPVNARIWVAEGEHIPLDGRVESDTALVEEALLTGESDWQQRRRGDQVFGGTLNRGAGFYVQVTGTMAESRVAAIDQLANTALDAKHHLARLADRVARVFVPAILIIAAATYAIWSLFDPQQALPAALAVLVVSCPCALSLATPAALTAALTRLRRSGVLVKNSRALEVTDKLTHVYFDKTGTLTDPRTRISAVELVGAHSETLCRRFAAALQAHAAHPLAEAFKDTTIPPAETAAIISGQGIEGVVEGHRVRVGSATLCGFHTTETAADALQGKRVYLSIDERPAAIFLIANQLRADAQATVAALRASGMGVNMLSGDNDANCAALAAQLGIAYIAASAPEAKPEVLRQARTAAGGILYVGDGVNDLPALAHADVSVATLETTDLVKSKADVLLLTRRLGALIELLRIGHWSRRIMRQNLLWAFLYNLLAIPLAALGYAPPWAAALGMSVSSLIVMANAGRILKLPLETDPPWKF